MADFASGAKRANGQTKSWMVGGWIDLPRTLSIRMFGLCVFVYTYVRTRVHCTIQHTHTMHSLVRVGREDRRGGEFEMMVWGWGCRGARREVGRRAGIFRWGMGGGLTCLV